MTKLRPATDADLELVKRTLDALVALVCSVAQANQPLPAVPQVVTHFLDRSGSDLRDALVTTASQCLEQMQVPAFKQHLAHCRIAEMPVGLFHEEEILVLVLGP